MDPIKIINTQEMRKEVGAIAQGVPVLGIPNYQEVEFP